MDNLKYVSIGKYTKDQLDEFNDLISKLYDTFPAGTGIIMRRIELLDGAKEYLLEEKYAQLFLEMNKSRPVVGKSIEDLEDMVEKRDEIIEILRGNCKKNHVYRTIEEKRKITNKLFELWAKIPEHTLCQLLCKTAELNNSSVDSTSFFHVRDHDFIEKFTEIVNDLLENEYS